MYGAKMQISVQMTELSKVTQFHGVYFFSNLIAWGPCGISLRKKMPPYSYVQQFFNCKQPDLESPCPSNGICLQNFPREGGRGKGFTRWPTDYKSWKSVVFLFAYVTQVVISSSDVAIPDFSKFAK